MVDRGVAATCIKGDLCSSKHLENCRNGMYRLIFTSPEMLRHGAAAFKLFQYPDFLDRLVCLAVDEAHLIQDWYILDLFTLNES